QLKLANPKHGIDTSSVIDTFPDDGTRLQLVWEASTDAGGGLPDPNPYIENRQTFRIATWPPGPNDGMSGYPQSTTAISKGIRWQPPDPDEELAGLKGWLPSGEIRYYGWGGKPRLAILRDGQFLDMPAPGSIDVAGRDAALLDCEPKFNCQ